MNSIKLSVCIPTYNRSKFLHECLERFTAQISEAGLTGSIEIVVSDNDSSDTTPQVVRSFQDNLPNLTYTKNETNLGVDRNVRNAIASATGEYIWYFSDDDWIEEGAIKKIFNIINTTGYGAMIINWLNYYPDGRVTGKDLDFETDRSFHSLSELLENVNSTFFLSSLVFKRALVSPGNLDPYFSPSGFFHWGVFLNAASGSASCAIIAGPLIGHRVGNEGYFKRWPEIFLNDMPEFFTNRAKELGISQKAVDFQLKNYLTRVSLFTILHVKGDFNRTYAELKNVLKKSRIYFKRYPQYYIFIIPAFFAPVPVIRTLLKGYRYFKNKPSREFAGH